ncbi:hypothetical protein Tco_0879119 [Tanacetum coccineum]
MDEGTKNYSFVHILAGSNLSVLVDKTKSARDGLKTAHTTSGANKESRADDISRKVKLEDLSDILNDTRSAFFTPDSPTDKPIIVSDESEEEKNAEKDKDTEDTSVPPPSSPKSVQIQELMAYVHLLQSQKEELEQAKAKAEAEVASIKAKPSYLDINQLTKLLFLNLPSQVSSVQVKLQTLDSLPSLLHKVTNTLNRFSTMVDNASGATSMHVPSTGHAAASPVEGEKNTKDAGTNLKDKLINLLGKDVVTQYYTKKLLFNK